MKKFVCMAMAAMMVAGTTPIYAAEWIKYGRKETEHTFTAKVGTTEFKMDGATQPLDVPVYIKDGYVMLPLRTFMQAVEADAEMVWHKVSNLAEVKMGKGRFTFDVNTNRIWHGGELLPVSGKMEVRDGRVFVPLRNWGNILNAYGYVVAAEDICWDAKTKTATIYAVNVELVDGAEPFVLTGEGKPAEYSLKPSEKYDFIQSIGDGYFIAKKYVNTAGDRRGRPVDQSKWQSDWFLLDETGDVLLKYDSKNTVSLQNQGEGYLRVDRLDAPDIVIDREGNVQFELQYPMAGDFSEGLAMVLDDNVEEMENLDTGYINTKGELVIPLQFYSGKDFSEGLAVAEVHDPNTSPKYLCGYIDTRGEWVIEPKYWNAFDFHDGIARVSLNGRVGYIDKEGNEIVKPRYDWGSDFYNGKAFVQEMEGEVFQIDTTGKPLKQITDGRSISQYADGILKQRVSESVAPENMKSVELYFDENGQISYEEAKLKANLSEGLAAMYDEKAGKYGYANGAGEWIITPSFDRAGDFEDGYAVVANETEQDVAWGIIRHPNQ